MKNKGQQAIGMVKILVLEFGLLAACLGGFNAALKANDREKQTFKKGIKKGEDHMIDAYRRCVHEQNQ